MGVIEAVKLRDALDANPVKKEDREAVERVKDMVASSLHAFAQSYDGLDTSQTTTTTQKPEPTEESTESLQAVEETTTDAPEPEIVTVLAPTEAEETPEEEPEKDVAEEASSPVSTPKLRPLTVPMVRPSNPFSNTEAFSFSCPGRSHVQGPAPLIRLLPSGGYYVYYNQG